MVSVLAFIVLLLLHYQFLVPASGFISSETAQHHPTWEFVVAHCRENLDWLNDLVCHGIPQYVGHVQIIVVDKCGTERTKHDIQQCVPNAMFNNEWQLKFAHESTRQPLQPPWRSVEIHSTLSNNWGFETEVYLSHLIRLRSKHHRSSNSKALAKVYFFLQGNPFDHIKGPEHHHNFYQLVRHAGPRSGGPSFGYLSDSYGDGNHNFGRIFCGALNVITGVKECPKIETYLMSMFYVHIDAIFDVPLAWFQRARSLLMFQGDTNKYYDEDVATGTIDSIDSIEMTTIISHVSEHKDLNTEYTWKTYMSHPLGDDLNKVHWVQKNDLLDGLYNNDTTDSNINRNVRTTITTVTTSYPSIYPEEASLFSLVAMYGLIDLQQSIDDGKFEVGHNIAQEKAFSTVMERLWHVLFYQAPIIDRHAARAHCADKLWPSKGETGFYPFIHLLAKDHSVAKFLGFSQELELPQPPPPVKDSIIMNKDLCPENANLCTTFSTVSKLKNIRNLVRRTGLYSAFERAMGCKMWQCVDYLYLMWWGLKCDAKPGVEAFTPQCEIATCTKNHFDTDGNSFNGCEDGCPFVKGGTCSFCSDKDTCVYYSCDDDDHNDDDSTNGCQVAKQNENF